MATKYARAGGGNWSADATWSTTSGGAADTTAPTAADDAVLDAASGNVTIDSGGTRVCRSINCTGYTGTLTHAAATNWSIGDGTPGTGNIALKFVAAMTYTLGNGQNSNLNFISTSTTQQTIDFAGKTTAQTTFNGVGGSWIYSSAHTTGNTATCFLTNGTLNTNGQTCSWGFFNGSGTAARALTLGASQITLTGGAGTHWNMATTTNLTFDSGTSLITMSYTSTCTFAGGDQTYYDVTFNVLMGTGLTVSGNNTFHNLNFTVTTGTVTTQAAPSLAGNQVITNLLTLAGRDVVTRLMPVSNSPGTTRTLTAASVSVSNADFMDITMAGAAAPISGSSLGDAGGNSGITFTAPVTRYRVGSGSTWTNSANWSDTPGGSGGFSVPLCHDDVFVDANASGTISMNQYSLGKNVDYTGFAGTLSSTIQENYYGSVTFSTGLTISGSINAVLRGRGIHTIRSNGKSFTGTLGIIAPSGSYTLLDAITSTSAFSLTIGTFDANGFNVTATTFSSSNTNLRTINMGSGTWTVSGTGNVWSTGTATNLTLNPGSSTIAITDTSASSKSFFSGGNVIASYNNVSISGGGSGAVIFSQSTNLNTLTIGAPKTITFTASSTHTFTGDFIANGTPGNLITIQSSSTTNHVLSKSSGIVSLDYVNISDSTATGGATFYAGPSSVDAGGGNSGWIFDTGAANTPYDTITVTDSPSFYADLIAIRESYNVTLVLNVNVSDSVTVTDELSVDSYLTPVFNDELEGINPGTGTAANSTSDSVDGMNVGSGTAATANSDELEAINQGTGTPATSDTDSY